MNKQKSVEGQQKNVVKKAKISSVISFKDLGLEKMSRPSCSVGFSTWVRSLMQNWRQGTVSCKGRSDVTSSNKKPWKQKGTGRARAGSAKSPIWRGGGVTFGPQKRVKNLKVPKKVKQRVLGDILLNFLNDKKITCLNWTIESDKPKTSQVYNAIKEAGIHLERLVVFLQPDDFLMQASFSNIPNVSVMFFDQANAFDLTNGSRWVVMKKDLDAFKNMVTQWI